MSAARAEWFLQDLGLRRYSLEAVHYGAGIFVGVGDAGTVITSPNAQQWVIQSSGTNAYLLGVGYGLGHHVAVGYRGALLSSRDGAVWIPRDAGPDRGQLADVAAGASTLVVVGQEGVILRSGDATNWVAATPVTVSMLEGVCHGAGRFVAVGYQGVVAVSTNEAVDWHSVVVEGGPWLRDVAWDGQFFVAVGQEAVVANPKGVIYRSADGETWSRVTVSAAKSPLRGVGFGRFGFVAVGEDGIVLRSLDGLGWVVEPVDTTRFLNAVAEGQGDWVVVGDAGLVLSTQAGTTPGPFTLTDFAPAPGGGISFLVNGLSTGQSATVQRAFGLEANGAWSPWSSITGTASAVSVTDTNVSPTGRAFYRLWVP